MLLSDTLLRAIAQLRIIAFDVCCKTDALTNHWIFATKNEPQWCCHNATFDSPSMAPCITRTQAGASTMLAVSQRWMSVN
ncbi:hypothetical protein C8Q75DRAFT_571021 [Abortiporus biennis]|nr:hypothetical protein C8Q75DRAFT_571021 [Abortiporus biennis]